MKAEINEEDGKWKVEVRECENHNIVFTLSTSDAAHNLVAALEQVETVEIP